MNSKYDFLIVGSGFGGSVSAMRLAQKGYRVGVIEAGKRYAKESDFPRTNWDLRKYLWMPILRCFGMQKITFLDGVMALHGAGVGGGSLVYAATLIKPKNGVFGSQDWPKSVNWEKELSPYYKTAKYVLGADVSPEGSEADDVLKKLGCELGVGKSYHKVESGIYFGSPGKVAADPFFNGQGPERTGCLHCGACMIGCRHGAKNSLDKNYLYLAEKWGAEIIAETTATKIFPLGDEGYEIETVRTTSLGRRKRKVMRAQHVILAAGVLGTLKLLLKNRDIYKTLNLPATLGEKMRTNGESLLGSTSFDEHRDLSKGLAIGASIQVDELTSIEAVRYPVGSNLMKFLAGPLTGEGSRLTRPLKFLGELFRDLPANLKMWANKNWAKNSIILLVMRSDEGKQKLGLGRSLFTLGRKDLVRQRGDRIPSYMDIAQKSAKIISRIINGKPQNTLSEVLMGTPATAHVLGGACIAPNPQEGVIDTNHEVFGNPGLYVCDGSAIPGNLGVNPSLTISALAERFSAQFPTKDNELFMRRQQMLPDEMAIVPVPQPTPKVPLTQKAPLKYKEEPANLET